MSRRAQGLMPWVWQRISALYLALFLLYFLVSILMLDQSDYPAWSAWISSPVASISLFIAFLMLIVHAWIGMKDVIMDYIHVIYLRAVVLMLVGLSLLACLIWLSRIMIRVVMT